MNTTELSLSVKEDRLKAIDSVALSYRSTLAAGTTGGFALAIATADAMNQLRELLDKDTMRPVMGLMNSPLGFLTDKDPSKPPYKNEVYDYTVVRDSVIEALMVGLQIVGNQFNIIARRKYTTREGFTALLKNLQGLTDLKITPGIPVMREGGAVVEVSASWSYLGKADSMTRKIAVRVNAGMGADAVLGKVDRKIKAAIYAQLTGTQLADGDASTVDDLSGMKTANAREVGEPGIDLPSFEQRLEAWEAECRAVDKYNEQARKHPDFKEEWLEPYPAKPGEEEVDETQTASAPKEKPWRDVVVVGFNSLKGRKLGSLSMKMLGQLIDSIEKMPEATRARTPEFSEIVAKAKEGIKELEESRPEASIASMPEPHATPIEGLRNLISASEVTENQVLAFILKEKKWVANSLEEMAEGWAKALITDWIDLVDKIKATKV